MNILCATDFSDSAKRAADVAAGMVAKSETGSTVQLLHSVPDWLVSAEMPGTALLAERSDGDLEREALRLRHAGISVRKDLRYGPPAEEVLLAAEDHPPHLVIMGSTGAGLGSRWLIGSVAERVASLVPVPILVVRNSEPLLGWLRKERPLRVLCAVDFTVSADAAMAYIKQLLSWGPVHVEAAHVTPEKGDSDTGRKPSVPAQGGETEETTSLERDIWERLHDALGDLPIEVYVRPCAGNSAATFLELAREREADLLVVGSDQRHGMRRLAAPSFSHGVIVHSQTNVLCVPVKSFHPDYTVPTIRNVLVATDFSPAGNHAILYAQSLLPFGGRIKLFHVCHDPSPSVNPIIASEIYFEHSMAVTKEKDEAETTIASLIPRQLSTSAILFSSEVVVHGDAAEAIREAAGKFGADVICMGTHGRNRATSVLLGSTVQRLISKSTIPIFVAHAPRV
ncbi:universal stress protein [Roseimicrobium gellanilyticum]|nr:universal stress protein [Roseimicrobium gellanilyticum]